MLAFAPIAYPLTGAVGVLAIGHLVPLLVALGTDDPQSAWIFALAGMLTGFCAGALAMATRGSGRAPRVPERLAFVVIVWFIVPAFAAIAFVGVDPAANFIDVYFEAVSAFTTTGATTLHTYSGVPPALLVWRASLQWYGGFMTVLLMMVVLAYLGLGGLGVRRAAIPPGYTSGPFGRYWPAIAVLGGTYIVITLACLVGLLASGMGLVDAICLSFAAISTGGMTVESVGLGAMAGTPAYIILLVVMMIGASNFTRHAGLVPRSLTAYWSDPEVRYLVFGTLALGVLIAALLHYHSAGEIGVGTALVEGLFWSVSLLTTTVFPVPDGNAFEAIPLVVALTVVFIGGGTMSTAGGLKLMRLALMMKQGTRELARLSHPHAIVHTQFGGRPFSIDVMKSVWVCFATMTACAALTAAALAAGGLHFEQSVAAAVGAVTNAGPVLGFASDEAGGQLGARAAEVYAALPVIEKLILCVAMVVGRVEVLAFLGFVSAVARRDI